MRTATLIVVLAVLLGACDRGGSTTTSVPETGVADIETSATPEEGVRRLLAALAEGRFDQAATFVDPAQWTMVALAEGADLHEVADVYRGGATDVGTNFWAGFVVGLKDTLGAGPGDLRVGDVRRFDVDSVSFAEVDVYPASDGSVRRLVMRDDGDGWSFDVVASFGDALVPRLAQEAEAVRSTAGEASARVLEAMRRVVPSLQAILQLREVSPELYQASVIVIETVTR